jgi:hypothetical protein
MSRYQVEQLAAALHDLGAHARDMASEEQDHHDDCLWCQTMVLLARTSAFGKQLRDVQLQEILR